MFRATAFLLVVLVINLTMANDLIGAFKPKCEADGTFSRKQCWSSIGKCFCVDPISGEKTTDLDCL
ncbi:unnamed protein product [Larinioides sclopetarius]|uniref:Thyroglobulin type-1 domain-containing protein n=1 Tax=Larinioides sclopetarius TaxID=280406 RepID=A0AAV2ANG9_9ARAC